MPPEPLPHALAALADAALAPLFWSPTRLGADSAWFGHVPFAHWLVGQHRPASIVELGTHNGVSYAAFCESALRHNIDARAMAVDTWQGDEHAGFYGDEVFEDLRRFHDQRYGGFSILKRSTFDAALGFVLDGSIDLLHIDGRHRYADVAHDFETWRPKLSPRAVVLFHDTNVREHDFGVFRLWAELRADHPGFEFLHGHGLGVLALGPQVEGTLASLCALHDPAAINAMRERFALLGERWIATRDLALQRHNLIALAQHATKIQADLDATRAWGNTAQAEVNKLFPQVQSMTETHRGVRANLARARYDVATRERELAESRAALELHRARLAATSADLDAHRAELAAHGAALAAAQSELAATHAELATNRVHLRTHADQAAASQAQLHRVRAEAAALQSRLELAGANAADQARALAASQAHAAGLERSRAELLGSTSWRLTRPLRRLRGVRTAAPPPAPPQALLPAPEPAAAEPEPAAPEPIAPEPDLPKAAAPEPAPEPVLPEPVLPDPAAPEPARSEPLPAEAAMPPAPEAAPAATPAAFPILFISGEGHTPGSTYRVERYVAAARALGLEAGWCEAGPVGPAELAGTRLVVLWRVPYSTHIAGIVHVAHEQGATVVFDVDDLMFRPELATVEIIDGIRSQRFSEQGTQEFFRLIGRTLRACDLVTCPTEELAHQVRRSGRPAYVLPNGFDQATHDAARRARAEWLTYADDLVRIGYAGGSRTHQRDFAAAAPAIARILREHKQTRLTLFQDPSSGEGLVLIDEFPEFAELADRIEWRNMVKLAELPGEIARFAINIAPLEHGNPFCEAKSELKFFEAALAGVPTIASPTGPFRRAISHGSTGLLAADADAWHAALTRLVQDPAERDRMAQAAYHVALARFGPDTRADDFGRMLAQIEGGAAGAAAFEQDRYRATLPPGAAPHVPASEVLFARDREARAAVTVIVPVFNYADYVPEALQSIADQTLSPLDLVVIEDASPDDSAAMVLDWVRANADRFNRIRILRHRANAGLGFARNSGFAAAETPFVLPLDADNRLRPSACETLLRAIAGSHAAFAYPRIQKFGGSDSVVGQDPYSVLRLQPGNYIDAMALVRTSAWARAGGYDHVQHGWEDFDFWSRIAERGGFGLAVPEILADYRVHDRSMLHTATDKPDHRAALAADMMRRHPWLDLE